MLNTASSVMFTSKRPLQPQKERSSSRFLPFLCFCTMVVSHVKLDTRPSCFNFLGATLKNWEEPRDKAILPYGGHSPCLLPQCFSFEPSLLPWPSAYELSFWGEVVWHQSPPLSTHQARCHQWAGSFAQVWVHMVSSGPGLPWHLTCLLDLQLLVGMTYDDNIVSHSNNILTCRSAN